MPEGALHCDEALAAVFSLLGKRWTGLVIGTLLARPARFGELASAIPGINDSMLSARLTELRAAGIVDRDVVPGPPISTLYRLTPEGRALRAPLTALARWAETNMSGPVPSSRASAERSA